MPAMRVILAVVAALLVFVHGAPEPASTSATPCAQNYVCTEPRPYDLTTYPDTGDVPPAGQFKCRVGWAKADPNFAFCYYSKNTGALVGSTPSDVADICPTVGMPNPACSSTRRRRELEGVPRRPVTVSSSPLGERVNIARFTKRQTGEEDEN